MSESENQEQQKTSGQTDALLDLSQPRTVILTDRGHSYRLECRRVTGDDWKNYFLGIYVSNEQNGREMIRVNDFNTPRIALAEAVLIDAAGYSVDGGAELKSLPDWQKHIPLTHKLKLADVLASARPSKVEQITIFAEGEVVMLDAAWSAGAGGMQKFVGLKHVLQSPSEEQYRRYLRESSRSFIQGGSRTGKTIYRGAQLLLAKLYDELIVSVEGYSTAFNGEPLTNDRSRIVVDMDMHHKVMAAQEIFQPQETALVADEEEA
jgi:hypothetical protein